MGNMTVDDALAEKASAGKIKVLAWDHKATNLRAAAKASRDRTAALERRFEERKGYAYDAVARRSGPELALYLERVRADVERAGDEMRAAARAANEASLYARGYRRELEEAIIPVLMAVNGRARQHVLNAFAVVEYAEYAELRLQALGVPMSLRGGCEYEFRPRVTANRHHREVRTTRIVLKRDRAGRWWLVRASAEYVGPRTAPVSVMRLTERALQASRRNLYHDVEQVGA